MLLARVVLVRKVDIRTEIKFGCLGQVEVYVQTHSVSVVVHILDVLAVFVLLVDCRFI